MNRGVVGIMISIWNIGGRRTDGGTDSNRVQMRIGGAVEIYKAIRSLRILHGSTHIHPELEAQRTRDTDLYISLLNNLRRKTDAGTAQPCIAHHGLEKQTQFRLTDIDLAYVLSPPLNAGIGPICIFLHTLLRWWHFQTVEVFF